MKEETTTERRDRVTELVKAKWPEPMSPNQFVNNILDIIRGSWFAREEVVEAIDALAWIHLGPSVQWENFKSELAEG